MENQMDTLKVYKHYQHARLQNEGDDMWISSEDLRTEGSSDEDTQHKSHGTKRNKKQRKSDLLKDSTFSPETPDISAKDIPSTEGPSITVEKSTVERNIDFNMARCSMTERDIFVDSGPSTSGISLASSDSGMDALNLESRWRPKRGSLKYPILVEGQTTSNFMHEVKGFYNEMMLKLKSLRSCPALDNHFSKELKLDKKEAKLFKHLKHTPLVKEKLKFIKQLDKQIKQTIDTYKAERSERLETQNEMCKEIYRNNKLPERDSQLFLEMCHFEAADDTDNEEEADVTAQDEGVEIPEKENNNNKKNNYGKDFIKRNVELAKEGIMAGYSLTDEEKKKLEELLANIDDSYNLEDETPQDSQESGIGTDISQEEHDDDYSDEDDSCVISNAYVVDDDNRMRIENIDNELEKFTLDETDKEKVERATSKLAQVELRDVLLEQRLKNINAKLADLYKTYEEDEEKLSADKSGDVSADSEASNPEQE